LLKDDGGAEQVSKRLDLVVQAVEVFGAHFLAEIRFKLVHPHFHVTLSQKSIYNVLDVVNFSIK
jgi:hypothetical protein